MFVFRNTGGISGFKDVYHSFVQRAKANNLKVFNELTGKADMRGKQYLLDHSVKIHTGPFSPLAIRPEFAMEENVASPSRPRRTFAL